jgi:hypothetical protein
MQAVTWLAIAMGALATASCAGEAALSRTLRTPQSMDELLLNVREATASGLILRGDFLSEAKLEQAFAAAVVDVGGVTMNGNTVKGAKLEGFPAWAGHTPDGKACLTFSVRYYKGFMTDGTPQASLFLGFEEPCRPRFADIERLFGTGWQTIVEPPVPLSPHGSPPPPPPATHPQGYARLKYKLSDLARDRTLELRFDRDGKLEYLDAAANGSIQLKHPPIPR